MIRIRRALLSVSDKTGIVDLGRVLIRFGCELISTGGTRAALTEAGIPTREIGEITGNPEAFGGRMKTLSFAVGSALLFDREKDATEAKNLNIQPIDMVVCNFYPFEEAAKTDVDFDHLIEKIDIGGPTMVRAAAKNFAYVAAVTSPASYGRVIEELEKTGGSLSLETRKALMMETFNKTADYDSAIAVALNRLSGKESIRPLFVEGKKLKYGENSHQEAWVYKLVQNGSAPESFIDIRNKDLSYNNYQDLQTAVEVVRHLEHHACCVVKHANPCGVCEAGSLGEAFEGAWEGDPLSAFGGIVAFNRPLDLKTAKFLELDNSDKKRRKFVDVIAAPSFAPDAAEYLSISKNMRIVRYPEKFPETPEWRLSNGLLLQQAPDRSLFDEMVFRTRKGAEHVSEQMRKMVPFGIHSVKFGKSNTICVVRTIGDTTFQLLGMGVGQPNRVASTRLALEKAKDNLLREASARGIAVDAHIRAEFQRSLLVSDGFFPFPDAVEECHRFGIPFIVQPGGSIRDEEVVSACNDFGIVMAFTGMRHFRH
ncbi:MAG: bifunctional phosphoribosylaminoimidazolecarboxamide formyltransferase/IMP cyclohydrolase [Candidatus Ozemobacteraceae bacterium]